jgi:hypothetical protein
MSWMITRPLLARLWICKNVHEYYIHILYQRAYHNSIFPIAAFTPNIIINIIRSKSPTSWVDGKRWTWGSLQQAIEPGGHAAAISDVALAISQPH